MGLSEIRVMIFLENGFIMKRGEYKINLERKLIEQGKLQLFFQ
jgi:hypothetical protein